MCIKDYETKIGGQGPVRAVQLLGKKSHKQSTSFYIQVSDFVHSKIG
jgi:hypothetical protein